jgi:NAD(P)-dependent dehydrogenase (short-subunit alcohol dehydrogenase family)
MDRVIDIRDKICIVTGATSGIGKATALGLAQRGATVVLICRNREKAEHVKGEILNRTQSASAEYLIADLSSQEEIRRVVGEFGKLFDKLDVLVNNAGATFPRRVESVDGIEMTLAVNHLAPFLLTNLLLDKLKAANAARVVNVSSDEHERGRIDFDDLQMQRNYGNGIGMRAYANAKLANLLTLYELCRRIKGTGVTANAVHPGYVATDIVTLHHANGVWRLLKPVWGIAMRFILSPEQGAVSSVFLACSQRVAHRSGQYFEKCAPALSSPTSRDIDMQKRMWSASEMLTTIGK